MDKKLNEVTKVTDMAYVPVIMADGSIGQIAKADLAAVVAGLYGLPNLNKSDIDLSGAVSGGEDLNTVINAGCYHGNRDVLNIPEGVSNYWVMLVFNYVSQWKICVQLLSCNAVNKMYIRYSWENGYFGAWKEL